LISAGLGTEGDHLPLFSGEYSSTIDAKNRVIVPAKMRQAAGGDGDDGFYVTRGIDDCIVIQTAVRFEQRGAASANEKLRQTAAGRMLERAIFSRAEFVKCDKQGRMLLPARLVESLRIGKNVMVVGVNDRIEIWDAGRWAEVLKDAEEQLHKQAEQFYGGPGEV
jgi:MraZ protein